MVKPKIHMIGNAHIDPVWLWVWQDGLEVAQSTCRDAVRLLEKYPDYVFSRSSAAVYRWIERTDPALFREIEKLVDEGRWNIVNGWWVQPDCNIPCGESLIRQGLYGQLYFKERFGRTATVGFNVDTFGHCGTIPQILRKCSLNSYVFHRPGIYEKDLPDDLFWWQSPDGSRVIASRIEGYGAGSLQHLEEKVGRSLRLCRERGIDTMCFYGKGDHGGGPSEEMVLKIRQLAKEVNDIDIIFSTPDAFFQSISSQDPELPIVADDLQHHSRGCYTVVSEIKAMNRRLESVLLSTEKICALAHLVLGVEYPKATLRRSWEALLFHQFHDVMGGTSIKAAYDDALREMGMAKDMAELELLISLEALSSKIRTTGQEGKGLLVFNPSSIPRTDPIRFHAILPGDLGLVAVDEEGIQHPVQVLSSEDAEGRKSIEGVFLAELPSLGYGVFWIREGEVAGSEIESSDNSIGNRLLRITVDPQTGFLRSIIDKMSGLEYLAGAARPIVIRDESDTWSHDVTEFRDEIGTFVMEGSPQVVTGPVMASIRVTSRYGRSRLVQTYRMYAGRSLVECQIDLSWHEKHKMLKLSYPTTIKAPRAECEVPYGIIERPTDGQEEPGQRWLDLSGKRSDGSEMGLLLLNDSKYGYDVLGSEMRISLVRSPIYAFHRPRKVERGKRYVYTDQGKHSILLGLLPHSGIPKEARFHLAERLNNPPIVAFSNPHEGALPSKSSLASCEPGNVMIGALKVSEEGDTTIIRLFESSGRRTKASIRIPPIGLRFGLEIWPWEIKTLAVTKDGAVEETNMLEEPISGGN